MKTGRTYRRSPKRNAGFTLVELLIGLLLLSLLTKVIFDSLKFGALAWSHGTERAEHLDRVLLLHNFLRQLISKAYPYYTSYNPTHPEAEFFGSRHSIMFLAPEPAALASGGRRRYILSTEKHGSYYTLILISQPELANDASSPVRTILLEDANKIEFAYMKGWRQHEKIWTENWDHEPILPTLVRIQIRIGSRDWPDIIIPLRIEADVGCVYDPFTRNCKGR